MTASGSPFVAAIAVVLALLGLLAGLRLLRQRVTLHPELARKLSHLGFGLITLTFPWIFRSAVPVLVVSAIAIVSLLALRYVPSLRASVGEAVHGVDRSSLGDLYFPIAVGGLFLLADGNWVLYTLPLLTLTLADAVAALIGVAYGRLKYDGAEGRKSIEGSLAFFLVAFLAIHLPLLLLTTTGRAESLLIGLTFGVLVMLLEAVAWPGLDNQFIPFGGFLLLRAVLALDAPALLARLIVTGAMLLVVLVLRRRRTLTDSAALAGALVGFVAWSVGGWHWVVPPFVLMALYTIVWPRNRQVRARPHDMVAVFSVTSTGLLWLLLSVVFARPAFYYPYTIAFAANLCFIGITWFRDYRRSASAVNAIAVTAGMAWLVFFVPYVLVGAMTRPILIDAMLGIIPLVIAGAAFVLAVPNVRNRTSLQFPWARQAVLGLGASALGLSLSAYAHIAR
jgi:phytol kinase